MSALAARGSSGSPLIKSEVLFWLGLWTLYAKFMLQATVVFEVPNLMLQALLLFGMAFLALRTLVVLTRCERPLLVCVVLGLALVAYFTSGETVPLTTFLVIVAAAGIGSSRIIDAWLKVTGVILAFMLVFWCLDAAFGASVLKTFVGIGGLSEGRGALLFIHPNYCAAFFFAFAVAFACSGRRGRLPKVAVFLVCLLIVAFVAGSRTSTAALLTFPVFFLLLGLEHFRSRPRDVGILAVLVPAALLLFTLYIAAVWFMGPGYSNELNDLLTGRPTLWWAQWSNGGVSLFGREAFEDVVYVYGTAHEASTIDSFYASALFNDGLAVFACLLLFVWLRFRNGACGADKAAAAAMLAVFVFGFCEWHAFNVLVCIPLVCLSDAIRLGGVRPRPDVRPILGTQIRRGPC